MNIKLGIKSILVVLLSTYQLHSNDIEFTDAGADHLWTTAQNWLGGVAPADSTAGAELKNDFVELLIEDGINAACRGFMLGMYGSTNSALITGGTLNCLWMDIGRVNQNGGDGTLVVSGGDIVVSQKLSIPNQFSSLVDVNNMGRGRLELISGVITAQSLHIGDGQTGQDGGIGELYISDGILNIQNNQLNKIQGYIDSGYILTDSYRTFELNYIPSSNLTRLSTQLDGEFVDIEYSGEGNVDDWSNTENWLGGIVPDTFLTGAAFTSNNTNVELSNNTTARCRGFMLGMYGATNTAEINGGILECEWLDIGRANENGGNATLTIVSGTITVNEDLSIPNQFDTATTQESIGTGNLQLLGGEINARDLIIGNGGTGDDGGLGSIFMSGGVINLIGDKTSKVNNYINNSYIQTSEFKALSVSYDNLENKTTLSVNSSFTDVPEHPYPDSNGVYANNIENLYWSAVDGANSYNLYFGTVPEPPFVASYSSDKTSHQLSNLIDNQKYYWRVEAVRNDEVNSSQVWEFTLGDLGNDPIMPPFTDYCEYLSQEIQGKKHGFLAGNRTYYIGGFHPSWTVGEHETIGFTHPFHHDLRSRGYGMVDNDETGYGHDYSGWEFYKHTKIAYGTVIINGQSYENPIPTKMYWRPDRMICEYSVGGVEIIENKYIALNDVACTMITSSQPIEIKFSGQSFYKSGVTVSTTASCSFNANDNYVIVNEGGVNLVLPDSNRVSEPGVMMYDGMSTILSASRAIENYTLTTEPTGQKKYSFTASCDQSGLNLVWYMNDDSQLAVQRSLDTLNNAATRLSEKTDHMNDLLNYQIPYFRCPDNQIVEVYYFLWAIYLMYNIDLSDESADFYAHTQSAVNNFMGLHRYDANLQIPVGSWTVNKEKYANGNVLRWKSLLDISNLQTGRIPADNIGKQWWSGLEGGVTGHSVGAWKIYQHSGDLDFLAEAYEFYRALMQNAVPGFWGQQYNAASCLSNMASTLGYSQAEIDSWDQRVNYSNIQNWFNFALDENRHGHENFFTFGNNEQQKGWTTFGYMSTRDFPKDAARGIVETHAVDGPEGFITNKMMAVATRDDWDKILIPSAFFITPDTNYFAIKGMYDTDLEEYANTFTIDHFKNYNYNQEWGVPCAPEAIGDDYEFFGDQYSNFNAGKILLILEGVLGLSYSVVDSQFTVADNLPVQWDYMETFVPVKEPSQNLEWVRVFVNRSEIGNDTNKKVIVENNPLSVTNINPWLENKAVVNPPSSYAYNYNDLGHLQYALPGGDNEINVVLDNRAPSEQFKLQLGINYLIDTGEAAIDFNLPISTSFDYLTLEVITLDNSSPSNEICRISEFGELENSISNVTVTVEDNNFSIFDNTSEDKKFYQLKVHTK